MQDTYICECGEVCSTDFYLCTICDAELIDEAGEPIIDEELGFGMSPVDFSVNAS